MASPARMQAGDPHRQACTPTVIGLRHGRLLPQAGRWPLARRHVLRPHRRPLVAFAMAGPAQAEHHKHQIMCLSVLYDLGLMSSPTLTDPEAELHHPQKSRFAAVQLLRARLISPVRCSSSRRGPHGLLCDGAARERHSSRPAVAPLFRPLQLAGVLAVAPYPAHLSRRRRLVPRRPRSSPLAPVRPRPRL